MIIVIEILKLFYIELFGKNKDNIKSNILRQLQKLKKNLELSYVLEQCYHFYKTDMETLFPLINLDYYTLFNSTNSNDGNDVDDLDYHDVIINQAKQYILSQYAQMNIFMANDLRNREQNNCTCICGNYVDESFAPLEKFMIESVHLNQNEQLYILSKSVFGFLFNFAKPGVFLTKCIENMNKKNSNSKVIVMRKINKNIDNIPNIKVMDDVYDDINCEYCNRNTIPI